MPRTAVLFYQEADGRSPVVEWLEELRNLDQVAYAKCAAVIERLEEAGYELRRPTADVLRGTASMSSAPSAGTWASTARPR